MTGLRDEVTDSRSMMSSWEWEAMAWRNITMKGVKEQ